MANKYIRPGSYEFACTWVKGVRQQSGYPIAVIKGSLLLADNRPKA